MTLSQTIAIYMEYGRIAFLKTLAYRLRYYTGILSYMINIAVYYFIWKAIFTHGERIEGYDLGEMVTYVAVGWIARRMHREVVVFPQPLTPTSDRHSPFSTKKLTSSTARTWPTTRCMTPRRMGKNFFSPLTSSKRTGDPIIKSARKGSSSPPARRPRP